MVSFFAPGNRWRDIANILRVSSSGPRPARGAWASPPDQMTGNGLNAFFVCDEAESINGLCKAFR